MIGNTAIILAYAGSVMSVLIADAMLNLVKPQGVLIAIQNGGGIRANLEAGEVKMGEILVILTLQSTPSNFEV